jgi:hypothetical protein
VFAKAKLAFAKAKQVEAEQVEAEFFAFVRLLVLRRVKLS